MKLYVDAIVTNELNQALFIQRDDSRTWAQPGGAVEAGETPPQALQREVQEETGLQVVPVRLVAVRYRPERPDGVLLFTFRCIQQGGELRPSPESPRVGFLPTAPLPAPMLGVHRLRVEHALRHRGGAVSWEIQEMPITIRAARWLVYGARDMWRRIRLQDPFHPPPEWDVGAFVIVRNSEGQVLWVKRRDYDVWNLPGGGRREMEPPWATAVRETKEETGLAVELTDLSGVYTKLDRRAVILTFTARLSGGELATNDEASAFAYFASGDEPENALPRHVERVADAVRSRSRTKFREQSGPSGLEQLGLG